MDANARQVDPLSEAIQKMDVALRVAREAVGDVSKAVATALDIAKQVLKEGQNPELDRVAHKMDRALGAHLSGGGEGEAGAADPPEALLVGRLSFEPFEDAAGRGYHIRGRPPTGACSPVWFRWCPRGDSNTRPTV